MAIEFRKVSEFQRGILVDMIRKAYAFDSRYEKEFLPKWKENDDFFFDHLEIADKYCLITTVNGEPIGHIAWDPRHLPEYAEIGDNCIIPEYKGQGYGRLQLAETIRRIKEYEVKKIIVMTDESLLPAQHNYESVGFKQVRHWKENNWEHIDYEMEVNHKE